MYKLIIAGLILWLPIAVHCQTVAPSDTVRSETLKSVVFVYATNCQDNISRAGSGFIINDSSHVVTAHHVIGGCKTIKVTFEGIPKSNSISSSNKRVFDAIVDRVLPDGDLGLLVVGGAPALPALRLSKRSISKNDSYAGFGYPLGVPSASDQLVTISVGNSTLQDILPGSAVGELDRSKSKISISTSVLRINVALQPGMSGGPIIDSHGEVIGVVAGGLKSGAAPVSWAWTREGVERLLISSASTAQGVNISPIQYSASDLEQLAKAKRDGERVQCGELEFYDSGLKNLADLMRGADDFDRVQHIVNISQERPDDLKRAFFRVWINAETGASAVVPDGYSLRKDGSYCVATSQSGPFKLLIWGAKTPTQDDVQWRSQEFEQRVIRPNMPYQFGFLIDSQLTTFVSSPMGLIPGPQFRPNGLVFNRKGFALAKAPIPFPGAPVPMAHGFHTLVAQSGAFLGVASLNDEVNKDLQRCGTYVFALPNCVNAGKHLMEWTRFIMATQLSTFPVL